MRSIEKLHLITSKYSFIPTTILFIYFDFQLDYKKNIWNNMNPELYTYFWLFTLDDIYVPTQIYNVEIDKIKLKLKENDSSANKVGLKIL